MPTTPPAYATLDVFKRRLDIVVDDAGTDDLLDRSLVAASRAIDYWTDRFFYQLAATTRVFTAECSYELSIPDLVSLTSIATDTDGNRVYETTWTTTDYDLNPENAPDVGYPFTSITLQPYSARWFPAFRRGVQITGTWGWPAVPEPVTEATLLLATALYRRPTLPFGLAGSAELAPMADLPAIDPHVKMLLVPFRSVGVLAG